MREAILLNSIAQCLDDMILPQHVFKAAGAVLSRKNLITHVVILAYRTPAAQGIFYMLCTRASLGELHRDRNHADLDRLICLVGIASEYDCAF